MRPDTSRHASVGVLPWRIISIMVWPPEILMFSSPLPVDPAAPTSLRILAEDGKARQQRFDAVVVCGGLDSALLLRPLGLKVPLAAVHGYSISAPIRELLNAPRSGLMDERYTVAISRLGKGLRSRCGFPRSICGQA